MEMKGISWQRASSPMARARWHRNALADYEEVRENLEGWYCPEHHQPTHHCWNQLTDAECWDLWYEVIVWR